MRCRPVVLGLCAVVVAAHGLFASRARADVPATYKGTPFKGTPQEIPGRIEFENLDLGGPGVAFDVQHHENAASGKDYRPGENIPQVCVTNVNGVVDKHPDGSLYPSTEMPKSYYIGWARPGDRIRYTVNVKQAGTYRLTGTFASDPAQIEFSIKFNDVDKTGPIKLAGTSNYHTWKLFENFATVTLDAGLQVMETKLTIEHLQYDYLEFALMDKAVGGTGGASGGSAGSGGGTDAGTPVGGNGGSGGGGGSSMTTGGKGGGNTSAGSGGSNGSGGAAADASASTSSASAGGGCIIAGASRAPAGLTLVLTCLAAIVLSRRRR